MRVLRIFAVLLLFVFTGIGIVGGCGGGGGGGGGGPEPACRVPPLDTNFSNELYIFFDEFNNVITGVSSDGEVVAIAVADNIPNPSVFTFGGLAEGPNLAIIELAVFEGVTFDASGEGVRLNNGAVFHVNDLVFGGTPLSFDIEGECDSVEVLTVSAEDTVRSVASDLSATKGFSGSESGLIEDFANEVLNSGE